MLFYVNMASVTNGLCHLNDKVALITGEFVISDVFYLNLFFFLITGMFPYWIYFHLLFFS